MKKLKKLANEMIEELCGAMEYAKCYQNYKEDEPSISKKYLEMANDEIRHAGYLHDMAVDIMSEHEDKSGFLDEWWEDEHDKFLEKLANVKYIISM